MVLVGLLPHDVPVILLFLVVQVLLSLQVDQVVQLVHDCHWILYVPESRSHLAHLEILEDLLGHSNLVDLSVQLLQIDPLVLFHHPDHVDLVVLVVQGHLVLHHLLVVLEVLVLPVDLSSLAHQQFQIDLVLLDLHLGP